MPKGVYKRKVRQLIIKNDYAIVPLTQGQFATIDLCDVERVSNYNWYAHWNKKALYAKTKIYGNKIRLHRFILDITDPKIQVDHRDGDGLENRRFNIRVCSNQQNLWNQQSRRGSSQFKGVSWSKETKKWIAQIGYNNKVIYLGLYNDEKIAAQAYNEKAKELFGEFARLNEI